MVYCDNCVSKEVCRYKRYFEMTAQTISQIKVRGENGESPLQTAGWVTCELKCKYYKPNELRPRSSSQAIEGLY